VARIEEQVMQVDPGQAAGREQLHALREKLGQLKTEALDRFTQGELVGKELLAGFLVQVNDVGDYLTRVSRRHEEK
jgi:hypothetical protein